MTQSKIQPLNQQSLNLILDGPNLALQLGGLVRGDTGGDNATADTTSAAKRDLGRNKNVGDVLIFTKKRQVEENLDGLSVGGEHNEFADTTIEGLGGFIGSLLQLAVVGRLLNDVENLLRQGVIGEGEGCCGKSC